MNTDPTFVTEESLMPSLFRIAGHANEASAASPKSKHRTSLADLMLEPKRLEAILTSFRKRKKSTTRRSS